MRRPMLATAACLAFGLCAPALAAPGGGSSLPSMPSGPQVDPAEAFREGMEAMQAKDWKTAERKFGDVLDVAPDHPEANYYMGLCKVKLEKDKQSLRYFKRAIKERDTFVEAREQLALASIRLGDAEEAQEQLDAIKGLQSACTPETCDQPYVDRLARAVERIETALAAAAAPAAPADETPAETPADAEESRADDASEFSYLLLDREAGVERYRDGVRAINEGRFLDAVERLAEAHSVVGPHPDILNYLGFANRKLGRFDAAKSYYAQALSLAPTHRGATEYLGELYLELGEIGKARRQLARLEKICTFGCAEREDLARLIAVKESRRSAQGQ